MARALPGPRGPAEVLTAWAFLHNPYRTVLDLHRRYGSAFTVGRGSLRYIYLIGPEANHAIFTLHHGKFRWREVFDMLVPFDGETSLIVSDGEEHKRRRHMVQPAFHMARIKTCVEFMSQEARSLVERLRPGQTVDIFQELRATAVRIITLPLFGKELTEKAGELRRQMDLITRFIQRFPLFQVRIPFPGTGWRRVCRARRAIDEIIYQEIAKRKSGAQGDDLLDLLLANPISDVEVRDHVASLIHAGYDTTSAAIAWTIYAMLLEPQWWDRAREECRQMLGDAPVTFDDLPKLGILDRLISESLRLHPPAWIDARYVTQGFEFKGYDIPPGSRLIYSPYVTHRLGTVWKDPERFNPERWNPAAPDYRAATPYEFLPFGGGPRRCIGASFALLEMKVVLAELVRSVRLELVAPERIRPTGFSFMNPNRMTVRATSAHGDP